MNCCVKPCVIDGAAGVTSMEVRTAVVTVRLAVPDMEPDVAVIVEAPAATAVARPVPLTVATEVELDVQVTDEVKSCVVLLL